MLGDNTLDTGGSKASEPHLGCNVTISLMSDRDGALLADRVLEQVPPPLEQVGAKILRPVTLIAGCEAGVYR